MCSPGLAIFVHYAIQFVSLLVRAHWSHLCIAATTQIAYPEGASAVTPAVRHLHPAQYPIGTPETNIYYSLESSAPPSLFSSTPYSSSVTTAGDVTTNPGDLNAPCTQPYRQPYPGVYSGPVGPEGHLTQLTSPCHVQPHTQSPIIHNEPASCYPSAEYNHNTLSSTGLLGQTLPVPTPIYKFPTVPAWSSGHKVSSTSTSPPHASPTHSVSSGHQEFLVGPHCSMSTTTAHSSTSTSPTAILTPHSDSTAHLSDQRSLPQSEPQSPLSPYAQHAPGSQCMPLSPRYPEYNPVVHRPVTAHKGLPSNQPSAHYYGADAPVVDACAGRSPLVPIYNVAHDGSIPSSHNTCHSVSHCYRRGVHLTPCHPPVSSSPTEGSITLGYPALTMPVHPSYGNRSQRCYGACCITEHDADDSDEPHAYAFIHNARETKKRPRRKFVSYCTMDTGFC